VTRFLDNLNNHVLVEAQWTMETGDECDYDTYIIDDLPDIDRHLPEITHYTRD